MTYIILALLIVLLYPFNKKTANSIKFVNKIHIKKRKRYILIVSLIFYLLIACRCIATGRDTIMYSQIYEQLNSFYSISSWLVYDIAQNDNIELGYASLIWFCHLLINYRGFMFIQAAISIAPVAYVFYKKSELPWLSFLLYFLLNYVTWNMCAGRQAPALSLTFLSYYFYSKEKYRNAILIFILAWLLHMTVIVVLPIFLLLKIKWLRSDKYIVSTIIVTNVIGNALMPIILPYMRIDYSGEVGESVGKLTYGGFCMLFFSIMYFKKKYNINLGDSYYLFSIMIVLWPLIDTIPAAFRITFYFMIYLCLCAPELVVQLKNTYIRRLMLFFMVFIGIIYFYSRSLSTSMDVYPYYSIFEYSDKSNYYNLYKSSNK